MGLYCLFTSGLHALHIVPHYQAQLTKHIDMNWDTHNFLREYWPIIKDIFLGLFLISYLRCQWRISCVRRDKTNHISPFMGLPDELILAIISHLQAGCEHDGMCDSQREASRDLRNSGAVSKRLRQMAAPILFKNVHIASGWWKTSRALSAAGRSSHLYRNTKSFTLAVGTWRGTDWEPSRALAPKLIFTLLTLQNLESLSLKLPKRYVQGFKRDFTNSHFELPGVRRLYLGECLAFVDSYCPNVESLFSTKARRLPRATSASDARALILAAGYATRLRHLELNTTWTCGLLDLLSSSVPDLSSLALNGSVCEDGPRSMLLKMKRLPDLKVLAVPDAEGLNIGFYQPGMCGNPFLGPGGQERLREEGKRRREERLQAAQPIAVLASQLLPTLEQFWIGSSMLYTATQASSGLKGSFNFRWASR